MAIDCLERASPDARSVGHESELFGASVAVFRIYVFADTGVYKKL